MKKTPILLLLIFTVLSAWSQEKLTPVQSNARLSGQLKTQQKSTTANKIRLNLPFIDDFSKPGVYPDPAKWADQHVYINNDSPIEPPTPGVATFDALNDTGVLYPTASAFPFIADYLTSNFIDLSSYQLADSLYFSFAYQPGGRGNNPETGDSLILEFLEQYRADTLIDTTNGNHDTTFFDQWRHVWSDAGMDADTFHLLNKKWFKTVMIPIKDAIFMRNDFQFRFHNLASVGSASIPSWRSDVDYWHVDYTYLNSNRTQKDTTWSDVSFVNQAPSFLKNYTSMTLRQYLANTAGETRDSVTMQISNLGKDTLICRYLFSIVDQAGGSVYDYDGGNYNLYPFFVSGYQNHPPHHYPKFPDLVFPAGTSDSSVFTITHQLERVGISQEFIKQNDTMRYYQRFYNYLAYDDGTAEAGYGLSPDGSMLAVKFTLNTPDTLVGVQMFFNRTVENSSQKNFKLMVWANDNGKPGEILYSTKSYIKPQYENDRNLFHTYYLNTETPLVLDNQHLTFFVGWWQQTDDNLNIGFDANNNSQNKILYNIDGNWKNTSFTGSLMIRPMLGDTVGIHKETPKTDQGSNLTIYPNPTSGKFTIAKPAIYPGYENPEYELQVFDVIGNLVGSSLWKDEFDFSSLPGGLYILRLRTTDHYLNYKGKILIAN